MMEPTFEDVGKEYKLYFKLTDLNANDPQSEEFEVKVLVIQSYEQRIEAIEEVEKEDLIVKIRQLDDYETIAVEFDKAVWLAQNFSDFN